MKFELRIVLEAPSAAEAHAMIDVVSDSEYVRDIRVLDATVVLPSGAMEAHVVEHPPAERSAIDAAARTAADRAALQGAMPDKFTHVRHKELQAFVCERCGGSKTSKNVYRWTRGQVTKSICNGCHGELQAIAKGSA